MLMEAFEYGLQLAEMVLFRLRVHNHVVQVHQSVSEVQLPRQFCMSLWNIAGALHNPYGILRNSYTPRLPTVKAVYCRDFSDIRTCQNPDFKSMLGKNLAPTMDSSGLLHPGQGV